MKPKFYEDKYIDHIGKKTRLGLILQFRLFGICMTVDCIKNHKLKMTSRIRMQFEVRNRIKLSFTYFHCLSFYICCQFYIILWNNDKIHLNAEQNYFLAIVILHSSALSILSK